MKTMKLLALTAFITMFLGGCVGDGPRGHMGPTGYDGYDGLDGRDGNANIQSFFYTIKVSDWIEDNNDPSVWVDARTTNLIDDIILDDGFVLFYVNYDIDIDRWQPLPSTDVYTDNSGVTYSTKIEPWFGFKEIILYWVDSHPTDPRPLDKNINIKVVVGDGYTYSIKALDGVDLKDYKAVETALNLKDKFVNLNATAK